MTTSTVNGVAAVIVVVNTQQITKLISCWSMYMGREKLAPWARQLVGNAMLTKSTQVLKVIRRVAFSRSDRRLGRW